MSDHGAVPNCSVSAFIEGGALLADQDIRALDLGRARRLLEIIKSKLGHDGLRELFREELASSNAMTEEWVNNSHGAWKSTSMVMTFKNISVEEYLKYFMGMVELNLENGSKYETLLRSAHPDHLMNIVETSNETKSTSIVVENFGEHEYPWELDLELGGFDDSMPVAPDSDYSVGMVATGRNSNGTVILYATHEFRDVGSDMEIKFLAVLPTAAPDELLEGHMRHFAVEWRNWYLDAMATKK